MGPRIQNLFYNPDGVWVPKTFYPVDTVILCVDKAIPKVIDWR